ncbi:MAG TPA: hypothetical protein VN155_16850 [Devosia sp.]|nr:hypothetical protein [Devosia sp.]
MIRWRPRRRGNYENPLDEIQTGVRYTPAHQPPAGLDDAISLFVNEIDFLIFSEFTSFAQVANFYLSWSHWTLEDRPETEIGHESPAYGRRMRLFFNRLEVGEVIIRPAAGARITKDNEASARIEFDYAQFIEHGEVHGLLMSLGELIVPDSTKAHEKLALDVDRVMARHLWNVTARPDAVPSLLFSCEGTYEFYRLRRDKGLLA